jgi:hypothetical protein
MDDALNAGVQPVGALNAGQRLQITIRSAAGSIQEVTG